MPLRIYRTDPLLGSVAAHDFDAIADPWNSGRLIGVEKAGYTIRPLSPFRPGDIRRQWRREINQSRGLLESAAIKSIIYRDNYAALPEDADEMLRSWLRGNDLPPPEAKHRLFLSLAKRQLRAGRAPLAPEGLRPALLHRTSYNATGGL
ncbi:hypothetical protein ACE7GA_00145 [Roseomonas sp. CCTCC AB2023176]|uniref:hypothetical protein n=1 Tax=Roseomonas sp. CCTCC AB2023176 TaxID=3342640 RepID=UPI0035DA75EB